MHAYTPKYTISPHLYLSIIGKIALTFKPYLSHNFKLLWLQRTAKYAVTAMQHPS